MAHKIPGSVKGDLRLPKFLGATKKMAPLRSAEPLMGSVRVRDVDSRQPVLPAVRYVTFYAH